MSAPKKKGPIRFDLEVPEAPKAEMVAPEEAGEMMVDPAPVSPGSEEKAADTKLDKELAERDLRTDLLNILKEPKVKGQIMGVVDFHPATPDGHLKWRHIMVDFSEDVFIRAWERYKQDHPVNPSAEAFIYLVFNIMDTDLPRLHKDIWHRKLE
ncbi:MAG: hypothetical protein IJV02_03500 [Candidatus Methanomethylophilaceae archaeon]|nr:hypothetical protein [Candidatus Methanomethylophilaceae archaeon]